MIANNLWRKNGGVPRELPFEDRDINNKTWTNLPHNAEGREECGWSKAPDWPDYDPTSESPFWDSENQTWEIGPKPVVNSTPKRIPKIDFARLFTLTESFKIEALEQVVKSADLTDPNNFVYGLARIAFKRFELASEYVELDQPEVASFLINILKPNGVLGDEATADIRIAQILSATFPE